MGLLDTALGMLGGNNQANDPKAMLIQAAIGLLSNQQQGGGLQNLLGAFQNAGLGSIVSSWVGTGQNLPISADQIQQALGGGHLSQLAEASGLSHEDTAQHLSDLLPGLIDKMTPNGQVPDHANIDPAALMQQFSSLFGKS
ncbi:MAG: YidB family protein [Burkholderiaceae bacterium]|nr:YidB family protein [Burkholderiaceae bacterium]